MSGSACLAAASMALVGLGCADTTVPARRAPAASAPVTVARELPAVTPAVTPAPAKRVLNNPAQQPDLHTKKHCDEVPTGRACRSVTATPSDPNSSPQRNCDTNIVANSVVANSATSCALAENAFYEYYEAGRPNGESIAAYSPATGRNYELWCGRGEERVVCIGQPFSTDIYVSFYEPAVNAYTDAEAAAYARKHEIGRPHVAKPLSAT